MTTRETLRPEAELLLCCARPRVTPETSKRIAGLLREKLDWAYLFRVAVRNGLVAFLCRHLEAVAMDTVPANIGQALRDYAVQLNRYTRFLCGELARFHRLFEENGIAPAAYTETTLVAAVYGAEGPRQLECLDFLVEEAGAPRAIELLLAQGFETRFRVTGPHARAFFAAQSQQLLWEEERGTQVQVHWAAAPRVHGLVLDLRRVWNARTLTAGGEQIPCLPPEELLLLLCIRGAQELWKSLVWVSDIAEVMAANPEMDWERILREAERLGARRMLFLGLRLAAELLGATLPEKLRAQAARDAAVEKIAAQVCREFFQPSLPSHGTWESLRFHLRTRERLRDRVRYLGRFLITPTEGDWRILPLPDSLFFFYSLLRPLRLAGSFLTRMLGRPVQQRLGRPESISTYVPTRMEMVERMLALGEVGAEDVVYDLGCGDGRILIEAAKRCGARGVGFDLDAQRIAESRSNARAAGVENRVEFVHGDVRKGDVSPATVVTLYLPPHATLQMAPQLRAQLRPGARVVSHNADIGDWQRVEVCGNGYPELLFLARVESPKRWGNS